MAKNTEFDFTKSQSGADVPVPTIDGAFKVAYDTSTASTNALSNYLPNARFVVVRITCTTEAFVTSGTSPTALNDGTHHYLPAGAAQDIAFPVDHKLAFVKEAVAGTAYVTVLR